MKDEMPLHTSRLLVQTARASACVPEISRSCAGVSKLATRVGEVWGILGWRRWRAGAGRELEGEDFGSMLDPVPHFFNPPHPAHFIFLDIHQGSEEVYRLLEDPSKGK